MSKNYVLLIVSFLFTLLVLPIYLLTYISKLLLAIRMIDKVLDRNQMFGASGQHYTIYNIHSTNIISVLPSSAHVGVLQRQPLCFSYLFDY